MNQYLLTTRTHLPLAREEVFQFFSQAENLERITPPELQFKILTPLPITIHEGTRIDYQLHLFGLPMVWQTNIAVWNPPSEFVDVQVRGPYRVWEHTHRFFSCEDGTMIEDVVEYALPFGVFGALAHPLIRLQLNRIFAFRETAVKSYLL